MNRRGLLGVAAVAIVAAGTWSLRRSAVDEPGPLAPLEWLVGGVWRPEDGGSGSSGRRFAWSSRGLILRETRTDAAGAPEGEVTYHWHHGKDEVALYGVLVDTHFDGLLRAEDGRVELQWKRYEVSGEVTRFREVLDLDGPDRLRWSLRRIEEDDEILDQEAILVRRSR